MSGTTRLDTTATVAALLAVTGIITGVAANQAGSKSSPRPAPALAAAGVNAAPALASWPGGRHAANAASANATRANAASANATGASAAAPARRSTASLALTGADRRACPAAAAACVDLARHVTWLQGAGKVTFGPVQMEPGKPGGAHQTPRGVFRVEWKAGPSFVSDIYHEPMPWATFFAAGGIAFHGGSLTAWSHGCVHLTDTSAHYFNEHLPVGAEVVVF